MQKNIIIVIYLKRKSFRERKENVLKSYQIIIKSVIHFYEYLILCCCFLFLSFYKRVCVFIVSKIRAFSIIVKIVVFRIAASESFKKTAFFFVLSFRNLHFIHTLTLICIHIRLELDDDAHMVTLNYVTIISSSSSSLR